VSHLPLLVRKRLRVSTIDSVAFYVTGRMLTAFSRDNMRLHSKDYG
jgi:hypothetical protein